MHISSNNYKLSIASKTNYSETFNYYPIDSVGQKTAQFNLLPSNLAAYLLLTQTTRTEIGGKRIRKMKVTVFVIKFQRRH